MTNKALPSKKDAGKQSKYKMGKSIYLAGFSVFSPDALAISKRMKAACAAQGFIGLYPLDNQATGADAIFQGNLALIRQADIVVADLNPFRGAEPDSGTAFELGYAHALGKPLWCYLEDGRTMRDKLGDSDRNGYRVENFGLPVNLMLAVPVHIITGDIDDCLRAIVGAI